MAACPQRATPTENVAPGARERRIAVDEYEAELGGGNGELVRIPYDELNALRQPVPLERRPDPPIDVSAGLLVRVVAPQLVAFTESSRHDQRSAALVPTDLDVGPTGIADESKEMSAFDNR